MGHGDEIEQSRHPDANFSASSYCSDGVKLFSLKTYQYVLIAVANVGKQNNPDLPIWSKYHSIYDNVKGKHLLADSLKLTFSWLIPSGVDKRAYLRAT